MTFRTRFAPSPTGPLHLGHAYSAATAWHSARKCGGEFLLRIEDVDRARARPAWEAQIIDDLTWLGLNWSGDIWRQSEHREDHEAALDRLEEQALIYPCRCGRADIRAALNAPQEGAPQGIDGPVYSGTCRGRAMSDRADGDALRLDIRASVASLEGCVLNYSERTPAGVENIKFDPQALVSSAGDMVLGRKGTGDIAYHLAVVVDDAAQGITEVVRGADLAPATPLHVLLQRLLGLPTPVYLHHPLVRDEHGKRLAKRDDSRAIGHYREMGLSPEEVLELAIEGAGSVTPWA